MNILLEKQISSEERRDLLRRPNQEGIATKETVQKMCLDVKQRGDVAVREYCKKFDGISVLDFKISTEKIKTAKNNLPVEFMKAVSIAKKNINKFHKSQRSHQKHVATKEGVECWRETRSIERVGLYIPAGSAPLPSTVLMLGIPAILAGCRQIILCSPPRTNGSVDPYVMATADAIGLNDVFQVGGVQAIAALAYGTKTIPKVDKIFGPGNKFVTAAKQYVSTDPDGASIDLLAGPSELLILADKSARPEIVAYDLISQAEHDADAQSILVTPDEDFAISVQSDISKRISEFPRREIIEASLKRGYIFVASSITSAIQFANEYAPEHLIINMKNAKKITDSILNAGSVFIGSFTPVTAGDYASGTNHTLPTGGTAKWIGGVSLDSFQKSISFQSITRKGLRNLSPTLLQFAHAEGLSAHARAVESRLSKKKIVKYEN
jgi:histidinol dehydrogenase